MPSRAELNIRAAAVGFDQSTIPNDSKLEQKVLYLEKRQTAITGTAPTTTLTTSGVFSAGETVIIGNVTYTFRAAVTNTVPNEVKIGAAATNSLDNLKDAINRTAVVAVPGTDYSSATKRHPDVTAGTKTASTLVVATTDTNANGVLATTETAANASFTGATLSAGTLGSLAPSQADRVSGDKNVSL